MLPSEEETRSNNASHRGFTMGVVFALFLLPFSYLVLMNGVIIFSPIAAIATLIVARSKRLDLLRYTLVGMFLFVSGVWTWIDMMLRIFDRNQSGCMALFIYILLYLFWGSMFLYFTEAFIVDQGDHSIVIWFIIYGKLVFCLLALVVSLIEMFRQDDDLYSGLLSKLGIRSLHDDDMISPLYSVLPFSVFTIWSLPLILNSLFWFDDAWDLLQRIVPFQLIELTPNLFDFWLYIFPIFATLAWLVFLVCPFNFKSTWRQN